MGGGASKKGAAERQRLEDARASLLAGKVETAMEMLESLRAKLLVPGKGQPRKGFEGLLAELDALRESGQKAKTALDAAHEEALVLMKDAEELLGKGEMQEAQAHFQSALEKYQTAFKTSEFAEDWLQLVQDSADASGPQWKECHDSMSIHGSALICEESSVGSAITSEVADRGKLVCEIKIKAMKPRPEGEDSDIFFGVMSESMELDDFWFEDEFEDRVWFYSDDGDICTGEETLEDVAASWAYKEGDSVRLELEFTTGEDRGVLKFYKNGALIPQHFTGVEGPVVAAVLMSDCQEGDCIEMVDLQYDPGQDTGEEVVEDVTDVLHRERPVFIVMDAFASSCRAHLQYISFREEDSKTTISAAKKALTRAMIKLHKATDKMRYAKCNSKKMELASELKSDFLGTARAKIAEAEALVEVGKLTNSFKVFDEAIALMQKIEESGMLKEAKKARQAAVSRRDLAFRNADRMMKQVRTKIKSEVMATFLEGFEESVKMAAESAVLFGEAGEPTKAKDAEITKVACDDFQQASQLANAANKSLENARITGVKHHFQKANDAFEQAAFLCTKNGNRAIADMLKLHAHEAMDAYQAVEAADANSPGAIDDEDMEKAAEEYADMLDGKPDEDEPDAGGSVEPCLTGVVSRRIMAPSKVFSVYVSSSILENEPERLCLVRDVAQMVRDAVVSFGFEFEFVDPFFSLWNAPELASNFTYRAKCKDVLKQCQAESAGVDYLCLVGEDDNGISFPGSIDFDIFGSVIKCIPDRGELGKLRKVIIEWFKLDTNSNPRKYVILDRKKKIPNLSSIDTKKKEIGQQEWDRQYAQLQKGFYEALNIQIATLQMQKIRVGILGKLGKIESTNMKKKVYELFCEIDVDGSGQIDVEELQTAFEQLDVKLTEDETRAFMDEFDEDRSGEIGFDEFLLIVEKLLLDAKNHEKDELIKNVDHAKYFKESLMYQDLCDGILDRTRDIALERSVAILWGFDPMQMGQELKYVEQGDEFDVQDSMALLRKENIDKKGGSEAVKKHEGIRPEWFLHTKCWQLKEMVFKRLVEIEEYVEENPPEDSITPDTPGSRGSGVMMLNVEMDGGKLEPQTPPPREIMGTFPPPPTGDLHQDGSPSREDTANDKFGGRRIDMEVWEAMSCRKSIFLKTLSDWEFMRVVSRSKRKMFRGSTDSPFLVVQPPENGTTGSQEDATKIWDTIKRMEDKITRLTDSERRERNAMAKARLQAEIKTCEETIQCLQADANRTMFVVVKGELEVILVEEAKSAPSSQSGSRAGSRAGSRPKTVEKKEPIKTKLAVLKRGDAFGDLTLVLGMGRDTLIQAVTPVDLALIRYDMVESLMIRNPDIESRMMAVVEKNAPNSPNLQTHFLTRAIAPDYEKYRAINTAMATNKSPLVKVLTAKEVEHVSKAVTTISLSAGVQLFRQDDGQETGWGPFGDSAFLVLEGELSVEITFEDGDKQGKPVEVARIMTAGESVGELNLVTGAPRTCTITTATACVLVEITRHQLSSSVHRDVRNDLMSYMADPKNGNVEARVLSQRTQHAMRLRQSTFLKQLSDIEIDFLAAVGKIRIEDKGTLIVKQGEWGDSAFVVLRGQLRVMVAFAEGEDFREVGRLKGADVFGEMTLLLDYPRSSTVEVLSKTAMLAEISREAAEKMLNSRPDIMDTMEMMLHGDEGLDDIMRARTPIGGRAATPGGVVATGLKSSISVVSYPWKAEANGMHAEVRGQSYIRTFAQKVANALFERIEPALERDHRTLNDPKLPLLQECSFHLDIAARKTEVFGGRRDEMRRLVDYIEGEYQQRMGLKNQPTIVMGEAGVGKSALLANAGIKAKARNPGAICVYRFMGWTQESLNPRRMMKSILTQLMTTFGMKLPEFPDSLSELRDMLSSMLEKASKQELITLILDAVDDLETPAGFMPSFEWLPMRLPTYSSIILSLKPTSVDCVSVLNDMFTGEVYFNIYALRPVDAQPVLEGYLDKRGKSGFSNLHFETIRKASLESAGLEGVPLNCSPLFLNLCMNLSEDWVSFNQCPALPNNIPDLVKLVYESLEQEHGQVLIERALSYLYTSREGLIWQELYDLLSCDDDVLDEVYRPQVPAYRRLPSYKGKLLSNDLGKLLEPRFNNQVPTNKFRYLIFREVVFERYGLENTVRQCSIHRAMANYFSGEWADGKEILHIETHQWRAAKDDDTKYPRGINVQSTFLEGVSRFIFHRRKQVANMRKIRELPHHICWSSGRSTKTIDPVGRALAQRPPSAWNSRHENDRNAQVMFQKHFCRLDIVEAACLSGYAYELHDDMLLAKKIFPYSELVRQFHKLVHEAIVTLAGNGHLTFQCALNSAGNGQGLINEVGQNMLQHYYAEQDRTGIPDVWFVHTNKDEVMDSLYVQYLGHWGGVFSVTISNRDDIVVTGGADCSVRLYDATSGNEVRRVDGHVEAVLRVSLSQNNRKIVSSSADMTAIIWDTATGDPLTRLEGHEGEVLDAIFLTDMVIMTASNDSTLRTWKVDTGQVIRVFSGHKSAVTCCISMAKGIQAISSSFDKTIRIWEVDSGLELLMLAGHDGVIYRMDLSRDQRKLLSCASDQMVKVWDLDEGLEIETLHLHNYAVTACAFDPTGCWIVTGGIDKTVRLFELMSTGDAVIIGEHTAAVCNIRFSNEGDFILSAGADGIVSKWEWAVAHQVATDSTPDHTNPICHVEFSSTGQHLISLSSDGVTILRVLDWQCCTLIAHQLTDAKDPATACKFAPNGLTVATLQAFGTLLWDTKTGNIVGRFAQVFDLYSLEFPEEIEYAVAPPMSPLVQPDGDMAEEAAKEELALQDSNAFNHAQIEILKYHAKDRHKKRFRADYLVIAREINHLEGGREVDWRAAREELNRLIKEEEQKAAEEQQRKEEEARAARELKKREELEELKRKAEMAKEQASREAERAIERLMGDFRFCEHCGTHWITSADSCSECNHSGPINLSEGSFGSCKHCESVWTREGNFCYRCGSERDRDAEEEALELGIGNSADEIDGMPAPANEKGPAPTSVKRSEKKGAEGMFEDGLHIWFDALKSIISGTESEVAIVRSLVQADTATLAQGKLNAEISVFGRELSTAEREAFEWNLEANVGPEHKEPMGAVQSGDAPEGAQPDENINILETADNAKDAAQHGGKKMPLFSSAVAKGALASMKKSFSFVNKAKAADSKIESKENAETNEKDGKVDAFTSGEKQTPVAEHKRKDLAAAKAQAKTAAAERKASHVAKQALLHEMMQRDAEIAIFGNELEQNERDDAWKGPKKRALEKQITKAVSAKKKSLENSLQVFLKNEGYGEIPEHLSSNEPEDPTTHGMDTASKDVKEADAPIIQESPSESGMILTKGLSLWMSGIAKVLTGPQEEIDLVKQLLQDEEAKLLLMKANAEVSVFGRELLPDEREAAWGKAHDDRLTFLRPAVEAQVLGRPLLDDERDQAWESGAKKKALFKAYSATVKRQRDKLRQTLESIQQADERMEQAASRQQPPSLDRPAVLNLTGTTSGSQDNAGKSPDTISHASTESDASSLRTAAREEAQARFQVLFSRATTPNETHGDLQSDRFGELGDDSRHTSFPDTPVAHVARPASAIDTENLGNADDADSQHGGVLQIVAVAHTAAADMDQIGLDDTSLQEVVEALGGKVLAPRAPEAPAESRPGTQSSVQTDKAIADEQGLHVLDRNNDGLVDEEEFREYTSSLHMVQYGASRVRISGVVLYNGGSAQPYKGINGDYVRSGEVCNFRAVYVKENKPGIAMWWANILGKISWCVGPKDQVGKDGMWAHVESMGFGPEEAGTRAWTVYSYNSGSWEEQTGVEVGAGSRPSSRGDSAVGKQSRPVSGIIKVDGDGGFDSRPPSRGELRTLSRPVSGIIKVEGDGGFDSRPPSRGDARMPGAGRPLSGIIKIEGDGGFDSRPPSRGDVRPGSSRPLSGIIKMDNFNSSTLDRAGDLLPPLVDKKKRLKSASRVNFTETHVQTFSEQDASSTLHGDLSLGQLETPAKSHAGTAGGVRLPAVERDALHREHDDPASGPSRRLGALFLGKHAFKVSDYIRASDAKEGVDSMYQPIRPDSRSGSYRSTPASSLAGSRSGTPASSRPTSGLGSRAGSSPGGSSRASSAGRRQRRGGGQRDEKYLKAKLQQQEKLAREAALREEQQKVLYETKLKLKTDSSKCIQAWCRSCLWRLCITEDFSDDPELYKFLNRRFSMLIALRIHCYFVRKKYEYDPYQSPMFLRYFSGCPRATLVANWECNVAAVRIDQRRFWDAHQCLKRALEDLHRNGMMRDMDILDLPTFHFSENDDPFGNDKTGRRENPFCAVPGCSRRPVKVCEWDGISKICDEHQFPSYWDRDTKSVTFFDKHPMNIAYPNRREFMWMNFLKGTDKRLGGGYEDEKSGKFLQCHIGDLVLPKSGVHGADKYGGNPLHFIEDILRQAWTITLPDDCRTLQEALDMAKDDSEIRFRSGYYAWKTPVEVRKRVRVTGEPGVVLHGPWTLDECAGGGRFENVTCITACGQGLHIRGGRWHFLRCTLRGYGEGVCVLSCGGETELVLEKSRVCGLNVDTGLWKPYTCLLAAGSSTVKVLGSTLQDASGYGMHVTNKAVCKIEKSEILRHYKAGLKLDQDADVLMTNSLMRDNTACFEAKGQNVPVPLAKYDPDPEVMYQEDQDCLQIFSNRIHGKLWATRQKPKLLLGKCQFKNSANKGDIIKDNAVDHNDSVAPEKPTSGTGHEAFKIAWPDNSALRVTDGSALIENYMFLRQMSGQNNPDARNPYVLEESGSWAESPDRMDYEHRPGTGMSRTSSGGILSRPGTSMSRKKPQNQVLFVDD